MPSFIKSLNVNAGDTKMNVDYQHLTFNCDLDLGGSGPIFKGDN